MNNVIYVDFCKNSWRTILDREIHEIETAHARGNLWFGCAMVALSMLTYSVFLFQLAKEDWQAFAIYFALSVPAIFSLGALAIVIRYRIKYGSFGTFQAAHKDIASDF